MEPQSGFDGGLKIQVGSGGAPTAGSLNFFFFHEMVWCGESKEQLSLNQVSYAEPRAMALTDSQSIG